MAGQPLTLGQIADEIEGQLEGAADTLITGVAPITLAGPGELSFVHNEKYVHLVETSHAGGLVVRHDLETSFRPLIRARDPHYAFTRAMWLFYHQQGLPPAGIHPTASVDETAVLGRGVTLGAGAMIGPEVTIEDGVVIWPGVMIGSASRVGAGTHVQANTLIGPRVSIGADCIIHSACRVGLDLPGEGAPQPWTVLLAGRVELGAAGIIDAGINGPTTVGSGTKIDDQLLLGAGAVIGSNCLIVAQVSIGAGAVLGDQVTVAGQSCVDAGLRVGSRVMIGAMSHLTQDIPDRVVYSGSPALPHDINRRIMANTNRIPRFLERVQALEEHINR